MKSSQALAVTAPVATVPATKKGFLAKNWHRIFVILPIAAVIAWDMIADIGLGSLRNPFLIVLFAACVLELIQFARGKRNQFITKWIDPSHGYTRVGESKEVRKGQLTPDVYWEKNEDFYG